jgi:regulator of protease activity HflC (stomatin/prohibitin superfamily)
MLMNFIFILCAVALLFVLMVIVVKDFKRTVVFEYERGLKYKDGKFVGLLAPGRYAHTYRTVIQKLDVRLRTVTVGGQDVLSADGISIRISLVAQYEIADVSIAVNKIASYQESLYIELQSALRRIVGELTIDELLEQRKAIDARLFELTVAGIAQLGLKLVSVTIRDIMFAGEFKKVFAQVVQARQEGLAALEKARGESAALRNLANAAKLLESTPALMQLRLLQAISDSSGHTIVLNGASDLLNPAMQRK